MEMLLGFYDADGDGKLTQVELDSGRSGQLATYDSDGDQQLTLEEYEALWHEAMRSFMVDRFQQLDEDGDGVVTLVEYTEPMSNLVAHKDRNGRRDDTGGEVLSECPRGETPVHLEEHFEKGDPEDYEWYKTQESARGKHL